MPFTSQKQRALFHAAEADPEIARERGIKPSAVSKMVSEDQPGKLPMRAGGARKLPTFAAAKALRK